MRLLANSNTACINSHYEILLFQHKFPVSKEKLVGQISFQLKIEKELSEVWYKLVKAHRVAF